MVRRTFTSFLAVGAALLFMLFSPFDVKGNTGSYVDSLGILYASKFSEELWQKSEPKTEIYNLLVRQIQLRLAELGFYRGLIGGVMSTETSEAIRNFERYANIPINGKATTKLLDHLAAATSDASKLLIRLDKAQTKQIRKARLALEKAFGSNWVEKTKALVVEIQPDHQKLQSDARRCYIVLVPACLIVEAEKAAQLVKRDSLRDWALSDVIQAKASLGDVDEALSVVKILSDPRSMIAALGSIAVSLSDVGKVEDALSAAQLVPDEILRDKVFRAVVEGYISVGRLDLARETVSMIEAPHVRLPALVATGYSYLTYNNIKAANELVFEAEEMAKNIGSKLFFEWALSEIAGLLAAIGNNSRADHTIDRISLPKNKVKALCDMVAAYIESDKLPLAYQNFKAARFAFSNIPNLLDQQQARACLAISNAKLGVFDKAIKEAKKIELGFTHSFVLSRIVAELSSSGRLEEAENLAQTIPEMKIRIRALISIRDDSAYFGYSKEASRLGSKAINFARNMSNSLDKVFILTDIALSECIVGNLKSSELVVREATNIAVNIKDPWARARALSRVSSALVIINKV